MKKLISLFVICALTISVLTGCEGSTDNIVNISILNSKPEIVEPLENVIEKFENDNKDIKIKLVKYSQSGSYIEKLKSMIVSENAPTMSIVDAAHISQFKDVSLDLSSEQWINDLSDETLDIIKNDNGQIAAFPFATEGMGLIYNKKIMDEAGIDVTSINTTSALEEAFKKVNAIGKDALIITNEEWSLADHFLATFYSIDAKESGLESKKYFESLKNIKDVSENKTFNGLMDTFDVMKKYNMYAGSPLVPSYDKCAETLGKGEVGFWYMGNWVSQNILTASNGNNEFGFIPVPVSNNPSDYGNNEITLGVTKCIIIDKNNSEEQQEAAKRFLNYLVYNEKGNEFLVEDCGIIPGFKNINVTQNDPLVTDIIKYRDSNKTIKLMNSYLPSDNSKILGNTLRKYLADEITREDLIKEFETFWRNS